MNSFVKRMLSVFCVILMVLVTYSVVVGKAGATSTSDQLKLDTSQVLSEQSWLRQLTVSDGNSILPRMTQGNSGTIHVVWIDGRQGQKSVLYKRSTDDGKSFSESGIIGMSSESSDSMEIVASAVSSSVAIAWEGPSTSGIPVIQVAFSKDDGANWIGPVQISEGIEPKLVFYDDNPILLFFRYEGKQWYFSSVLLDIQDGAIQDAKAVCSFICDPSPFDAFIRDDVLTLIWTCALNGVNCLLTTPVDLLSLGNMSSVTPYLVATSKAAIDTISFLEHTDGNVIWSTTDNDGSAFHISKNIFTGKNTDTISILNGLNISRGFSVGSMADGTIMTAWTIADDLSIMHLALLDSKGKMDGQISYSTGNRIDGIPQISAIDDNASLIWSSVEDRGNEIIADLDPLLAGDSIENFQRTILREENKLDKNEQKEASKLMEITYKLTDLISSGDFEKALLTLSTCILPIVNGGKDGSISDDLFINIASKNRLYEKADSLAKKIRTDMIEVSSSDASSKGSLLLLTSVIITNVVFNTTATSATIRWGTTPFPVDSTYVKVFIRWNPPGHTNPVYETKYAASPPPGESKYGVTFTGLDPTIGHDYTIYAIKSGYNTGYYSGVLPLPQFNTSNIVANANTPTTALVQWQTNDNATSVVEFGLSENNLNRTTTGDSGMAHCVQLTNLIPGAVYHYHVKSVLLLYPSITNTSSIYHLIVDVIIPFSNWVEPGATWASVHWSTNMVTSGRIEVQKLDHNHCEGPIFFFASATSGTYHEVEATGLEQGQDYQFRIYSTSTEDPSLSDYICPHAQTNTFELSDVTASGITAEEATIAWKTSLPSTSQIYYRSFIIQANGTKIYGPWQIDDGPDATIDEYPPIHEYLHRVTLEHLNFSTHYQFKVHSVLLADPDLEIWWQGQSYENEFTTSAPAISNVHYILANAPNTLITWHTNCEATSKVYYKLGSNGQVYSQTGINGTEHSVYLLLQTISTYYFYVESRTISRPDIVLTTSWTSFYNGFQITSGPTLSLTVNGATISWTTSYAGTSVVNYGTTDSLGSTVTGSTGTSHSITISGLQGGTRYYYQVFSQQTSGGSSQVTSSIKSFTTMNIRISNVAGVQVTSTSYRLTWNTYILNAPAAGTSCVMYQTKSHYDLFGDTGWSAVTGANGTTHSVTVSGLASRVQYVYKIVSIYVYNTNLVATYFAEKGNSQFELGIVISNVAVKPSANGAIISWDTNVLSNTKVYYGLTRSVPNCQTESDGTHHTVTLAGLTGNTVYYFKVSSSAEGDSAESSISCFNTTAILGSNVHTDSVTSTTAQIIWKTNIAGTSRVDYGTTASYGNYTTSGSGTDHIVSLSGLIPDALYHFKVTSASSYNSSDVFSSGDFTVLPLSGQMDAGVSGDAGGTQSTARRIATGIYAGTMNYAGTPQDTTDFYNLFVNTTQLIDITMTPQSGYNFNLYLFDPSGVQKASSTQSGSSTETIAFTATSSGNWAIKLTFISGSAKGRYDLKVRVSGMDAGVYNVDAGTTGDMDIINHTPGLSLVPSTGWGGIQGSNPNYRQSTINSTLYLNLYSYGYMDGTDILLTLRYYASQKVNVSTIVNGGSILLATLDGPSAWRTASLILPSSSRKDYSSSYMGLQCPIVFSGVLRLDTASACPYSYTIGNLDNQNNHTPGIWLDTGWTLASDKTWNGSYNSVVKVTPSRSDQDSLLTISFSGSNDTCEVQQYDGTTWRSIGLLQRASGLAYLMMNSRWYYDTDTTKPGINVKIRFVSGIRGMSSLSVSPGRFVLDVGTNGDTKPNDPGLNVTGTWSSATVVDGRTVRQGTGTPEFRLNSPLFNRNYTFTVVYKATQATGGSISIFNGVSWVSVVALTADTIWHSLLFKVDKSSYYDIINNRSLNLGLRFSIPVYCDYINASVDTDNDGLTDFQEALGYSLTNVVNATVPCSTNFDVWEEGKARISVGITGDSTIIVDNGCHYRGSITITVKFDGQSIGTYGFSGNNSGTFTSVVAMKKGAHTIQFTMSGTGSARIGNVNMRNAYETNPVTNDTDADGFSDYDEINSKGTDPNNPDTDGDGLLDGQEVYGFIWGTEDFYRIPDNGGSTNRASIPLSLPAAPTNVDTVLVHVGIMHPNKGDLKVLIQKGATTPTVLFNRVSGGANLFETWDLRQNGYTLSDFASAATWTLYVEDYASGNQGHVEYYRLEMDGHTDPLKADTDYDGLSDYEETQLGNDGWITHPILGDSDGDGLGDGYESSGSDVSLRTNPTNADSDQDGFNDLVDKAPANDLVLHVNLTCFMLYDPIPYGLGQDYYANAFVHMLGLGHDYSTNRKRVDTGCNITLWCDYYFDIRDDASQVTLYFEAWADQYFGDTQIDVNWGAGKNLTAVYNIYRGIFDDMSRHVYVGDAHQDPEGGPEGNLTVYLEAVQRPKANVVLVNGTGSELYQRSDGTYRCTEDAQYYVLYVNSSVAAAPFVKGTNVILVPRYIALSSQLNQSLLDPSGITSGSPLYGFSFSSTNTSASVSSGSIVAIIAGNVTDAQKAIQLLRMVTRNSTSLIAENRTVTGCLHLLGLPGDVLQAVPLTNVQNSPLAPGPLDIWGDIVRAVGFLVQGLINVALFFLMIPLVVGAFVLKVIGELGKTFGNAIAAAAQAIVNAFQAIWNWVWRMITDAFNTFIGPFIRPILQFKDMYCQGVHNAIVKAENDVRNNGSVQPSTLVELMKAITGPFYWVIVAAVAALEIVLLLLMPITFTFGFVIGAIVNIAAALIINEALKVMTGGHVDLLGSLVLTVSGAMQWILGVVSDAKGNPTNEQIAWSAFGGCMSIAGTFYSLRDLLKGSFWGAFSLVMGVIAIALGWYATAVNSYSLGLFSIAFALIPLTYSIVGLATPGRGDERILSGICAVFSGLGIYCGVEAL